VAQTKQVRQQEGLVFADLLSVFLNIHELCPPLCRAIFCGKGDVDFILRVCCINNIYRSVVSNSLHIPQLNCKDEKNTDGETTVKRFKR
jgi:hypothetical protein